MGEAFGLDVVVRVVSSVEDGCRRAVEVVKVRWERFELVRRQRDGWSRLRMSMMEVW